MKKRARVKISILVVLLVLVCVPMHVYMKDGGSQGWYAILWQYTKYHKMLGVDEGWRVGPRVTLLGFIPIYFGRADPAGQHCGETGANRAVLRKRL